MQISQSDEKFLRSTEHCRFSTIDEEGYPHCVPVAFTYHDGRVYFPTSRSTAKVRNLQRDPKSCVTVDVYERGKGRGVMIQGLGRLCNEEEFPKLKGLLEEERGWHLDSWKIEGSPVDSIIVFEPAKVTAIGERYEGV